jgi:protein-S-isoprenylcysteine O-methyltransferase Ste14
LWRRLAPEALRAERRESMSEPNRFQSLPSGIRRPITVVFAATFIVCLFGLLPQAAADLNRDLGWPRWQTQAGKVLGVALFLGSVGLILYCSRLFARLGKGTPVPINPPTELVVSGLFRFSRNPIYVGQVGVLLSYALYSGELALLLYALAWAAVVQCFVVWVEEPELRGRFGPAYEEYCRAVPRWVGVSSWGKRAA